MVYGNEKIIPFFQGAQVGPSPAQAKKTITWAGELWRAILDVEITGWELERVIFNGKDYWVTDPKAGIGKYKVLVDVRDTIINGDNVMTVHYKSPIGAFFGQRETLSGSVEVGTKIPGTNISLPGISDIDSANLGSEKLNQSLANATVPTIAILAIIAAIVIAVAIIIAKLKGGALFA